MKNSSQCLLKKAIENSRNKRNQYNFAILCGYTVFGNIASTSQHIVHSPKSEQLEKEPEKPTP